MERHCYFIDPEGFGKPNDFIKRNCQSNRNMISRKTDTNVDTCSMENRNDLHFSISLKDTPNKIPPKTYRYVQCTVIQIEEPPF